MTPQTHTLKLLINKKEQKVLFAEAGKDFVDFLFSLLSLPLAIVAKVLAQDGVRLVYQDAIVGSLCHVYRSVQNLGDKYMESIVNKDKLLRSRESLDSLLGFKFKPDDHLKLSTSIKSSSNAKELYGCVELTHRASYVTDSPKAICPVCKTCMEASVGYVPPPVAAPYPSSKEGYVKDALTYLVMDDLDVTPLASIISSRHRLMKFSDHELEERVVRLGMDEVVCIN